MAGSSSTSRARESAVTDLIFHRLPCYIAQKFFRSGNDLTGKGDQGPKNPCGTGTFCAARIFYNFGVCIRPRTQILLRNSPRAQHVADESHVTIPLQYRAFCVVRVGRPAKSIASKHRLCIFETGRRISRRHLRKGPASHASANENSYGCLPLANSVARSLARIRKLNFCSPSMSSGVRQS